MLYTCNRQHSALTRANGTPGDRGGAAPCGKSCSCTDPHTWKPQRGERPKRSTGPHKVRAADILGYKLIKQSVPVGRANQAKCSDRGSILRQQKGSRSPTLVLVSGAKHEGWGPTAQGIAANSAIYPLSLCFATKCIWVRNGWASSRSAAAVLIRHR